MNFRVVPFCSPPSMCSPSFSGIFILRGVSLLVPDIISFWHSGRHTFQKTQDKPILSYISFFKKKRLLPEAKSRSLPVQWISQPPPHYVFYKNFSELITWSSCQRADLPFGLQSSKYHEGKVLFFTSPVLC